MTVKVLPAGFADDEERLHPGLNDVLPLKRLKDTVQNAESSRASLSPFSGL